MDMVKPLLFLWMVLISTLACAQTDRTANSVRKAFEGIWQYKQKYGTNTVRIQFEEDKDYALFTDIGNGMAPERKLHAALQGDLLVIPAKQDSNDYVELQIVKGKLHLRVRAVNWDENGKEVKGNEEVTEYRIFQRVKGAGK